MAADYGLVPKARQLLIRLKDEGGRRDLIDRLGEFFPQATDFAWLTDDNDEVFRGAFHLEQLEDAAGHWTGGWLDSEQYNRFWGCVSGYSEEIGTGELEKFIEGLLARWEQDAASAQYEPADHAELDDDPRFLSVGPVDGYAGWWQGYDDVEGVWKYVRSAGVLPDDRTRGWVISSVAFPEPPATAQAGEAQFGGTGATAEERAEAVYAQVLADLEDTELTADERTRIWHDIWARVSAVSAWGSRSAAEIAAAIVDEFLAQILYEDGDKDKEVDGDELIAEIQAIRTLLLEHARSPGAD